MPVREISTRISLDGEKEFKQAIAEAGRQMRVMNSELKQVAAEFDLTGDAQKYYTDKTKVLKNEIAQQKQIIAGLEGAVEDTRKSFTDGGKAADGYQIKLNNATAKLKQMEKQLRDTEREAEEFGRDSRRVGQQIEDGIGDGAEEATKSLKSLVEQMSGDLGGLRDMAAVQVMTEVGGGVVDTIQSVVSFVESNRDYRVRMARTRQSVESAGYAWDEVQELLFEAGALTGDMEGAQEGMANLARLKMGDEWMKNAVDLLGGASILWQDTLKFENLAESLQETVASGTATGAYAELLERLGIDLEKVNAAMKDMDEAGRANEALTWLAGEGILEAKREYEKNNEELLEAQRAQIELTDKWAQLAGELEPIVTALTVATTNAVDVLIDALKLLKGDVKEFADEFGMTEDEFRLEMAQKTGNSGWMKSEDQDGIIRTDVGDAIDNIVKGIFGGGNAEEAGREAGEAYAEGFGNGIKTAAEAMQAVEETYAKSGADAAGRLLASFDISEEDKQTIMDHMWIMGRDITAGFDAAVQEGMGTAVENAGTAGANVGTAVANGIAKTAQNAIGNAWDMANGINEALASIGTAGVGGVPVYSAGAGGSGSNSPYSFLLNASVDLDGQKVGTLTASSVSQKQGRDAARLTRYM